MTEDVVRSLGHLTLGSRLKRLGERLQGQTQQLHEAEGISLSCTYFPLLAALDRLGELSVGELTQALGITQPGVTRMLDKLEADGLVTARAGELDRRSRMIALSAAGRTLVGQAKSVLWPRIEAAVADACAALHGPLLDQLTALEEVLSAEPLSARAARLARQECDHDAS